MVQAAVKPDGILCPHGSPKNGGSHWQNIPLSGKNNPAPVGVAVFITTGGKRYTLTRTAQSCKTGWATGFALPALRQTAIPVPESKTGIACPSAVFPSLSKGMAETGCLSPQQIASPCGLQLSRPFHDEKQKGCNSGNEQTVYLVFFMGFSPAHGAREDKFQAKARYPKSSNLPVQALKGHLVEKHH